MPYPFLTSKLQAFQWWQGYIQLSRLDTSNQNWSWLGHYKDIVMYQIWIAEGNSSSNFYFIPPHKIKLVWRFAWPWMVKHFAWPLLGRERSHTLLRFTFVSLLIGEPCQTHSPFFNFGMNYIFYTATIKYYFVVLCNYRHFVPFSLIQTEHLFATTHTFCNIHKWFKWNKCRSYSVFMPSLNGI